MHVTDPEIIQTLKNTAQAMRKFAAELEIEPVSNPVLSQSVTCRVNVAELRSLIDDRK